MISPQTVDRIKEAARIEEVVGEFVQLKKRGANMIGLCPFHQEKTPSFSVNPARNIYKCFGCGRGGDSIDFLKEHEHLTYPESLRWLAERYQIEIEEEEVSPEQKEARDRRESLYIVTAFAAEWYAEQLLKSDEGRSVGLAYYKERGFRENTIEEFGMGWCPSGSEAFTKAAIAAGYKEEFLIELGLTKTREGRRWDFFRERVIFPIHNLSGKVIGFGARTLKSGKKIPKYVNSPESEIYNKSRVLYGIYQAKRSIIEQERAYLVEGYTDVISLHQAGIKNVVASSGTALTPDQVRLISRYTNEITILYDGDSAGIKAAMRGTEIILEQGMNVRMVLLPEGEDPDSLVKSMGSEAVKAYLEENSQDFVLFKAGLLLEESQGDPIKKAALVKDIVSTISKVQDTLTRSLYVKETARIMDLPEQILIQEVNKSRRDTFKKDPRRNPTGDIIPLPEAPPALQPEPQGKASTESWQERALIRLLFDMEDREIEDRPAAQYILEQVAEIELKHPIYSRILQQYREGLKTGELPVAQDLLTPTIDPAIKEAIIDMVSSPYTISENWEKKHDIHITNPAYLVRKDIEKVVGYLKIRKLEEVRKQLMDLIKEADDPTADAYMKQLNHVNKLHRDQTEAIGHYLVDRKKG